MSARRSIEVDGLAHPGLPIPAASRVGPIIMTGGIRGVDRGTGVIPDDLADQARLMFENMLAIIEAGGGSRETIVKMTTYVATPDARSAINAEWVKMFPDPASRPARHTLNHTLPGGMLVQCDATAVAVDSL